MSHANVSGNMLKTADSSREGWLLRLNDLVASVQTWAKELGWSTRKIEKRMTDSGAEAYSAPGLLLQEEAIRILLEPIARSAPGAEGVVDLYLMPAYDDIASLYFYDGAWHLHYMFPETPPVAGVREAQGRPFSKEVFREVLQGMMRNASQL